MVTEITFLACAPGSEPDLEASLAKARELFEHTKGCKGVVFRRSVEVPTRYLLLAEWETTESHTVGFHNSGNFKAWRALVMPYLTAAPAAEHVEPFD